MRAEAQAGERLGKDGAAQCLRQRADGHGKVGVGVGVRDASATDDHAPLAGEVARERGNSLPGRQQHRLAGFNGGQLRETDDRIGRQQRFAESQIQVHRAGQRPATFSYGTRRQLVQPVRIETRKRCSRRVVGAHLTGKQSGLIDGLIGAPALQFRRPVGRQKQQRHGTLVGLYHGRQPVGCCGSGGAQQRNRFAGGPGATQCKPGRTAFIEDHLAAQLRVAQAGQGQRCRARTGRDDHLANAGGNESGNECGRPVEVELSGLGHGPMIIRFSLAVRQFR
ncbi:MAG: hypothetical protein QG638_1903 [Pseudomonadota bacterium]|nr:hypothetical protein [Pseudomonadota bacterium]